MASTMRRLRSQRGASSIEFVLYTPIMFLVIFTIVQFALVWHGNQVAAAAAREAARVARIEGGTPDALARAEAAGRRYVDAVGGDQLVDVTVTVTRAGDNVVATVSGRATEIIDDLTPRVSQTIEGPIEQFIPDQ